MRILEKSQDFSRISISYLLCLFNPSSALTLTLKKLEHAGYTVSNRLRGSKGKIIDMAYVIYETPHPMDTDQPCEDESDTSCSDTENPDINNPCLENRPQLNKEEKKS